MTLNPVQVVARAQQQAPLTPFERAFLKFLQGALIGIVIDAGNILLAYYSNAGPNAAPVDWVHLLIIPLGTGFMAALLKWLSAQGDAALAQVSNAPPAETGQVPASDPGVRAAAVVIAPPGEDIYNADTVNVAVAPMRLSSQAPQASSRGSQGSI